MKTHLVVSNKLGGWLVSVAGDTHQFAPEYASALRMYKAEAEAVLASIQRIDAKAHVFNDPTGTIVSDADETAHRWPLA